VVACGDGVVQVRTEGAGVLEAATEVAFAPDAAVALAVRPEKWTLTRAMPATAVNALAGVIDDAAYLGGVSVYRVRLASGITLRASAVNVMRGAGQDVLTPGASVVLSCPPESIVVLTG
jgi:putrescine transport system ATP-binding protein